MSDYMKYTIVSKVTSEVERINRKIQELVSTRTRAEKIDLKNSDIIQRSDYSSIPFTDRKWIVLMEKIKLYPSEELYWIALE